MTIFNTLILLADAEQGAVSSTSSMLLLTVFVLAIYVGVGFITKIEPTSYTSWISGSNAISGIILIGAILLAGNGDYVLVKMLGGIAVALATINVVAGFLITHRMLENYDEKKSGLGSE